MNNTRNIVLTALFIAAGVLLPLIVHFIPDGGKVLLPMHIPVILCGLCLGASYGAICGTLTPLLSSLLIGMPVATLLPAMMCELALYGFICGLLSDKINARLYLIRIYSAMIPAMIVGRLAAGIINTYVIGTGTATLAVYLSTSILKGAPGIVLQLVLIPILVGILTRASVIDKKWV